MPLGSMVVSKSGSSNNPSPSFTCGMKSYDDILYDRRECSDSGIGVSFHGSPLPSPTVKGYKGNHFNRRLGRVGLPHSAAVHSNNSSLQSSQATKNYVDNSFNRSKGRVGKPLGSMPISRKITITSEASNIYRTYTRNPEGEIDYSRIRINEEQQNEACDVALSLIHRMEEVMRWQKETSSTREPHTSDRVLQNYRGIKNCPLRYEIPECST
ncbi:unnamed protein product [Mytilus edulis]|uniref:Uncharacterized protein n=1 Tax=Mytilus edulis TaxID=6550 RepID=A0A8S3SG39_MYTED|nr:unnamed protein product [Mytilus edulis]